MAKPRIGLSMLYTLSQSFSEMLKQLRSISVSHIEIVDEGSHSLNRKRVKELKEIAKQKNLLYSVHAPFADINVASPSKTMLNASMKRLTKSLEFARDLNAYLWVLHPGNKSGISSFYPGEDWKQNLQSISLLNRMAKNYGITIALENLPEKYNFIMRNPEDFARFYDETGLVDIGVVLDTGHANLEGQIVPFLQKLPKKITHIHISDNHGQIDEHLGMGYGKIDWNLFSTTLKSTEFAGTLVTESVYNVEETLQQLSLLFA